MAKRYRSKKAYRCWDCDKVYLDKQFAQSCCAPKECRRCGELMEPRRPYIACDACREIIKAHRVQIVGWNEADDGVVYSDTHPGEWGDGYSSSIEAMEEIHRDEGLEMPSYVHPCQAITFQFDPSDILDRCHDNHHEGAVDQIVDTDSLFSFFQKWNAKQTLVSYHPKLDRVIVVDQRRFQELLDQPEDLKQ